MARKKFADPAVKPEGRTQAAGEDAEQTHLIHFLTLHNAPAFGRLGRAEVDALVRQVRSALGGAAPVPPPPRGTCAHTGTVYRYCTVGGKSVWCICYIYTCADGTTEEICEEAPIDEM